MVLLSFNNPDSPEHIRSGKQTQAIRPFTSERAKEFLNNETLHLWFRSRRPDRFRIGNAKRSEVLIVRLFEKEARILNEDKELCSDTLAKRDGFESYNDLYMWFCRRYCDLKEKTWLVVRWDAETFVPAEEIMVACPKCHGTGINSDGTTCALCNGYKQIHVEHATEYARDFRVKPGAMS